MVYFPYYKDGKLVSSSKITNQQITVAKILYCAYLHESFMQEVSDRGDTQYTVDEYFKKVIEKVEEL